VRADRSTHRRWTGSLLAALSLVVAAAPTGAQPSIPSARAIAVAAAESVMARPDTGVAPIAASSLSADPHLSGAATQDPLSPAGRNPRHPAASDLGPAAGPQPFEPGTSTLELTGVYWLEAWNKNLATDRLFGGHASIGHTWARGWQALLEIELLRADLVLSPDAFFTSLTGHLRRRVWQAGGAHVFVEAGVGISAATDYVPTRGTTFNYLVEGGAGLVRPIGRHWAIVGGLRVWHLSNGGTIRGDDRNPDIEAIGGYAGVQLRIGPWPRASPP
jgi:hypothetical protein